MKSLSASLTHYCLSKHTTPKQERQTNKWGSFTRFTLPSHPFAAELRHQLWWRCAVLLSAPGWQTLTHSDRRAQISRKHTCLQNYPDVQQQIKANLQLKIFSWLKIFYYGWINVQPLCSHYCSQESIQALLWRCIFLHWFQYRSGLPSAMRPLPIINGKQERRERGRGEWWLPWQPLSFLQLRASD